MKSYVTATAAPLWREEEPAPAVIKTGSVDQLVTEALDHLNSGWFEAAVQSSTCAIALAPRLAFARLIAGVSLSALGRGNEAVEQLQYASRLDPQDAQIRYNLAVTLQQSGQDDLAMLEYTACLELNPWHADALWNYGEMLRLREHFSRALTCFEQLLAVEGIKRPKMAHRMAVCCSALGLDQQAEALFCEQIESDDDPHTHWEYAHHLLGRARFAQAWPHYARRFDAGERISLCRANYPYPFWNGELERGAALVVQGEQGAGDEILFATFLHTLLDRATAAGMRVIVACRPALVRLFQASFADAIVLAHEVQHPTDIRFAVEGCQKVWQVMIGDLGRWLEKPSPKAYLVPQPEDVAYMAALVGNHGPRIGLAVSANPYSPQANRRQRNVNAALLNALAKNLQCSRPGVRFYSLHTAECRAALAALADVPVYDLSAHLSDFSRTAALMIQMDIVVSVCTSTANLAGALGCDTHVLLQRHADWRWFDDTAWFAHAKTYRQEIPSDWSVPLNRLFAELAARCAASSQF
jgi:tetratricopeptide (TPR) repeat protein